MWKLLFMIHDGWCKDSAPWSHVLLAMVAAFIVFCLLLVVILGTAFIILGLV